MKKTALLLALSCILPTVPAVAEETAEEYTYVAYKDTSVSTAQPDRNYGDWISAICADGERAYYSFDISGLESDDALISDPPNPRLGFWFEGDLTNAVKERYEAGITNFEFQVVSEYFDATTDGRFYTREASFNKPHLKVVYTPDKKSIKSAKIYLFGGSYTNKLNINAIVGTYDEMTMTYRTRPLVGKSFGYAKMNPALSGRPEPEHEIYTIAGKRFDDAATTTLTSFSSQFPDSEKWWDVYDMNQIPSVTKLISDFKNSGMQGQHPRTIGNKESWERVRRWYKEGTNEYVMKWAERLLTDAEAAIKAKHPDYPKLNDTGSDMSYRGANIPTLGMAYQLTLDRKYADSAYEKMALMAGYETWNPMNKDLNIGECAKYVGQGYDLVYEALTPEQRSIVVSAIVRLVLDPRLGKPNGNLNNWNPVTNGGFGIAGIAVMDEQPNKGAQMISQSIGALPASLLEFYPDGGFPEGVGYWNYMTSSLFAFTSALVTTFGTSYGLEEFEGLEETGNLLVYTQGPKKGLRFKYGDDPNKVIGSEVLFYLAQRYNNPLFAEYQFNYIKENKAYADFAPYWCTDETFELAKDGYKDLVRDRFFDGHTPVVTMRSSWEDENALFAGIKGGYPQHSHHDLDIGTFLLSALGVEWAYEIYPDHRDRVGFPSVSRLTRYMHYAASPQGHNTLLFNPGMFYPEMDYGQELNTLSKIEKFHTDENSAYTILDMSDAYRKYAGTVKRGLALINNRREFIIQDEITGKASNLTYWFMHTEQQIEVNGNEAILTDSTGNKRLYCKILEPSNAEFVKMPWKALPGTPTIFDFDDVVFDGMYKLAVKTEIEGDGKIAVWMVPLSKYDEIPTEEPTVVDLEKWPMPEGEITRLGGVTINGKPLETFSPEKLVYDVVTIEKDFEVEAFGEGITINKLVYPDSVTVECSAPGKKSAKYVFNQIMANDLSKITITASDTPQAANSPENTLDGDISTRWSSTGAQTLDYDLGEIVKMDSLSIAFYQGATRLYNFKMEISVDGENWNTVHDGKSSGITAELTKYSFEKQDVRYVKISCNENNVNEWNNIGEVVFGYAK